jgi:hypothetical protein
MTTALRTLLLGLLVAASLAGYAQTKADCKEMLREYQRSMTGSRKPGSGQMLMAHLTVTTVPAKDSPYAQVSLPNQELDVRMIIGPGYLVYESPYLALYRDARECFTVIHPQRLVMRTSLAAGQNPGAAGAGELPAAGPLTDSPLLELSMVQSCRSDVLNGQPVQVIELLCNAEAQRRYRIGRMVYYFDAAHRRVLKQELEFVPGHPTLRQTIVYHTFDPHYRHKPAPAATFLFSGNQLKEKFRGYAVEKD